MSTLCMLLLFMHEKYVKQPCVLYIAEIEAGNRYCHTSCLRDGGSYVSFVESENRLQSGEGERMLPCNI